MMYFLLPNVHDAYHEIIHLCEVKHRQETGNTLSVVKGEYESLIKIFADSDWLVQLPGSRWLRVAEQRLDWVEFNINEEED